MPEENVVAYTPQDRPRTESSDQLRARIPGWGADLNPADRPAVPRLQPQPADQLPRTGLPPRQPETRPRERSIEHSILTPVFGTSSPTHGLSGVVRRLSYRRYSEARAAHWLLLLLADRIDSGGSAVRSFATTRPDNPVTETGIRAEVSHHGLRSRIGQKRADVKHQWLDPFIVAAPWVARVGGVVVAVRAVVRWRAKAGHRSTFHRP